MLRIKLFQKIAPCDKLRQTRNRYLIRRIPRQKRGMILHLTNIPFKPRTFISRRINAFRSFLGFYAHMINPRYDLYTIRRRTV